MCRKDDVREARGLAELILPSQRDAEEGTGGLVLAGSALLGLEPRPRPAVVCKPRSRGVAPRRGAGVALGQ